MINTTNMSRDLLVKLKNACYWRALDCKVMNDQFNYNGYTKRHKFLDNCLVIRNAVGE